MFWKIISVIVLVLLIGAFYWQEIRPVQIKKECAYLDVANNSHCAKDQNGLVDVKCFVDAQDDPNSLREKASNSEYRECLIEHGIFSVS